MTTIPHTPTNASVHDSAVFDSEKADQHASDTAGHPIEHRITGRKDQEAAAILANHHHEPPVTPEEEKAVLRKIDRRLMPIMAVALALQTIDKGILGTAAVFGLIKDLHLSTPSIVNGVSKANTSRYSNVTLIFYVGILAGSYPLTLLCQKFPIAKTTGVLIFLWAVVLYMICACDNYAGAMTQRFFLGVMESGVSPAFLVITSMWYKHSEQSFRVPLWYSSGIMGLGLSYYVNYGLVGIKNPPIALWRIIFIFWASITIVFALVVILVLPDSISKAKFLTEREKYVALERLRVNQDSVRNKNINASQILSALSDWKVIVLFLAIYCCVVPNGLCSTFTPVVVAGLGYTPRRALLLSGPGSIVGAVFGLVGGYLGMVFKQARVLIIIFELIITLIGCVILWKINRPDHLGATLLGIYFVFVFSSAFVQQLALSASNTGGYSKKVIVSSLMFVAYSLGNITSPKLFFGDEAPNYVTAFKINSALICVAIGLMALYGIGLTMTNRKREAGGIESHTDRAFQDLDDRKNLSFRYAT